MYARKSKTSKEALTTLADGNNADDEVEGGKKRMLFMLRKHHAAVALMLLLPIMVVPFTSRLLRNETHVIPECASSPWKPYEDLVGTCPGDLKPFESAKSAKDCATACCATSKCTTWQFRRDVGCKHGPDVRIGMEKDGPSAYCSDTPPVRWQGQYVLKHENQKVIDKRACNTTTWNPQEQQGQCFGLGDVRKDASATSKECMEACCADETCGAWQWQADLGCFYGPRMFSCSKSDDPVVFEPFVGRRKFQKSRKYIGQDGKPWKQKLE